MIDPEGQVIKSYVLKSQIGAGSFANIYRAYQPVIERDVAIKVIHPQFANNPDFVRRFEVEAQIVAWLEHPHIVPLYDYWREPDGAFLVMRWLRGGSLRETLRETALPLERIANILDQVTAALATAHRNGIVHQDIKPDNLLLDTEGNVYLSDFGIARSFMESHLGKTGGTRYGSPAYVSPETFLGQEITPQSDIYSLGIMLYEFLTGTLPFGADEPSQIMEQHAVLPMPSVRSVNPELPKTFDEIVWKATAKHPEARYVSAPLIASEFRWAISADNKAATFQVPLAVPQAEDQAGETNLKTLDLGLIPQPRNPFKGLRAFEEADMHDFFGRDTLIATLLKALDRVGDSGRFLAVVGPSGSGKSSVVKAGLIPALRQNALKNSGNWFITMMVPGAEPLNELQAALLKVAVNTPERTLEHDAETELTDFLKDMLPETDSELLLVIDQFEEVFTLVETEAQRERFLTSLHKAIIELKGRFGVVITLRADYYHRPLLYSGIGELVSQNTQVVLPLTASELAQVVSEPTRRAAIAVSDELVATIVADVSEQPGALPLMEYTLTELFERRQGNLITLQEYEDSGGVSGTLARRANELYESLESDHLKQAARKMFLALVAVGVDTDTTRRRARQSDILAFEEDRQLVFDLLDRFGAFRLLTFDREPVSRAPTVEIAHEALISEWALLQQWIDSSRDDLRARSRLAAATDEWSRSNREPSYLASGERLSQFDELARRQVLLLNDAEAAYLSSSIALRNRNRFRLRLFVASLIVLTILAIGAALVALERQESAISERDRADLQAQIARSRELAVTALTNLDEQLDLAMLLSVEAYDTSQTYEARRSLLTAIQQEPQLERFMHGHTDGVRSVAFSTDGQLMASGGADDTIRLWDAASMQPLGDPLVGHTDLVNSVTFNASGTLLASGSSDGTIRLWEVETGEAVTAPLSADQGAVWSVSFSHDGRWLASGGTDGTIVRWDLASYRMVGEPLVGHQDIVYSVAFSPDNRFLASASADNTIRLWIANTGLPFGQVLSGHSDWVLALTFSPNGRVLASTGADARVLFWDPLRQQQVGQIFTTHTNWIRSLTYIGDFFVVTGSTDGTLRIWDVTTGNMLGTPLGAHDGAVWSVASNPLSARIVSGGVDHNVIVWDLAQSSLLETDVMQQGMPVIDLAISPQGDELVSGGGDLSGNLLENVVMLWNVGEAIQQWPRTTGAVTSVAISPDGQIIAASGAAGTIALWNAETGAQLTEPLHGHTNVVWAMAFGPDGQWLATASDDQTIILWNASDGWAIERTLEGHTDGILALAFSPDGKILASGGRDNTVRLWNLESDQAEAQVLSGHLDFVTDLAFNPAGDHLASASRDNTIIIWDVANAVALSQPLARHNDRVLSVAYSPDGQTLASGGQDNQIVLWDVVSLQPMGIISTGNRGQVNSLVFGTSGQRLYSGQQDGSIITWNLSADSWAALACRTAGRSLSIEEQISYLGDAGYAPFCTFGVEAPSNES